MVIGLLAGAGPVGAVLLRLIACGALGVLLLRAAILLRLSARGAPGMLLLRAG